MKAKKKKIDTLDIASLGIDIKPRFTVEKVGVKDSKEEYRFQTYLSISLCIYQVADPPTRAAGIKVTDVDTLFDKLRNDAKVL